MLVNSPIVSSCWLPGLSAGKKRGLRFARLLVPDCFPYSGVELAHNAHTLTRVHTLIRSPPSPTHPETQTHNPPPDQSTHTQTKANRKPRWNPRFWKPLVRKAPPPGSQGPDKRSGAATTAQAEGHRAGHRLGVGGPGHLQLEGRRWKPSQYGSNKMLNPPLILIWVTPLPLLGGGLYKTKR